MTWLTTFYSRALVVLLQVALVNSGENGPLPGFTQQPVDTILESSNQSIICQVKGERPLVISWRKNGVRLDILNSNYLSISREGTLNIFGTQKKRDEGEYRCVVENKFGRIVSRSARVSFPYMKAFSVDVPHVRVNEGDQAFLSCHAPKSYPDRNIHWLKKEERGIYPLPLNPTSHFSTSESGDLYFSYTTSTDKGLYVCSVENNILKQVLKRKVTLEIYNRETQVNIAPQVWLFKDKVAMKDSNLLLECIAYGRPTPVMQFRHHATGKVLKGAKQVGNRLRYEFGRFQSGSDEKYWCELNNTFGQISRRRACIKVEAKPQLKRDYEEISFSIDSNVHIPCFANGIPIVRYTWYFNGIKIEDNRELQIFDGNLTIPKVMRHHQGFYQCVAANRNGEAILTVYLKVVEMLPSFGAQSIPPPERTHAVVGGKAEIHCIPSGAPKPSVKWIKRNNKNYIKNNGDRFITLPTGTLRIVNIRMSDQGTYDCIASNRLGRRKKGGELLLTSGLAITQRLTNRDVIKTGETLSLLCIITSYEEMEIVFTWKLGNRRLYNSSRTKIYRLGPKRSLFEIKKALNRDTGNYKCLVHGTKDRKDTRRQYVIVSDSQLDLTRPPGIKTTAEAYKEPTDLIVKGVPYPPKDVTATEPDGRDIKITWTMGRDNGSPVKKMYIQAITTYDRKKWITLKTLNSTRGNFSPRHVEILTLSPWAEYKFRLIAENSIGLSRPSRETHPWIRTPSDKPETYPKHIKGIGIAPNMIKVSFRPLQKIDQNAPGISYYIYYKAIGMSYEMIKEPVPSNQNEIILTFRHMDSYWRLYEFQLQAKNDAGYGPMSPIYTAYTGERTPVDIPRNLRVMVKAPTAYVEASWDEVSKSRQAMRGEFKGYKLLYWVKPTPPGYSGRIKIETTYHPFKTVELRPFTEYYFQVLAYNNEGDGPASEAVGPFRTPEGVPSIPSNLRITDASAGQATITWNEPEEKNGILKRYILTYFVSHNGKEHRLELDMNVHRVEVSGLSPTKEYTFKLSAVTTAGVGDVAVTTFNFSKVPSVTPDTPTVVEKSQTTVVLKWTPVNDTNILGYKVFYWHSDGDAIVAWEKKDDILATIHYLQPDRKYYFQIAVFNKYGTGPKSKIAEAHTSTAPTPTAEMHPCDGANNGGCQQVCSKKGHRLFCTCDAGFKLDNDGKSCVQASTTPSKKRRANVARKLPINNTLLIAILLIAIFIPR